MKSHITWALVGASVVTLGFSSVMATGAAWRASAPASSGANLSAGRLDISSGASGNAAYTLADFGLVNMGSSSAVAKPLQVFNSGNVPMKYGIQSVTVAPQAPATTAPPLTLVITSVANAGACTTATTGGNVYNGPMSGASTSTDRPVAAAGSEFLCLVASLGAGAAAGQSGKATFTFRALVNR
ncbi:hypothetical protein [Dietzia sp. B32]|uniref:hypothetical protein n=1 Tax=Dietzia sp. B32 TaxID=2915130 RepID=UPI0021AE25DE|nr:hypothetical protein [Dietzia sp. B32]UVE96628.1 hypothetical protein L8M95_07665 [Dietzia sp. B32]